LVLEGAKLLYLALDKKSETGWDSVRPMFAAFSEDESSYYVGRGKNATAAASLLDEIAPPGCAILGALPACSDWPCLGHSFATAKGILLLIELMEC
jgi:hypothetical protein